MNKLVTEPGFISACVAVAMLLLNIIGLVVTSRIHKHNEKKTEKRHKEQMDLYSPCAWFFKLHWDRIEGTTKKLYVSGCIGNNGRTPLAILQFQLEYTKKGSKNWGTVLKEDCDEVDCNGPITPLGTKYGRLCSLPWTLKDSEICYFQICYFTEPKEGYQYRLSLRALGNRHFKSPPWPKESLPPEKPLRRILTMDHINSSKE